MRFVTFADLHLAQHGPVSRMDDWEEALFAKLDQVAKVAVKAGARAVLNAGDTFHQKSREGDRVARIPYGIVYRLMGWCFELKKQGIEVLATVGNHDIVSSRYESLSTQPLGLLFQSGAMVNVSRNGRVRFAEDRRLGEAEEDPGGKGHAAFSVGVSGIPYPDAMTRANFDMVPAHGCDRGILLAHCFAAPQDGSYFGDAVHGYGDLAKLPFDVFVFGHDHSDHGIHVVDGKYFINVGALSRGSLVQEEVTRDVQCTLLEVLPNSIKVQKVKLRVKPAAEVFDLALKAQKDRERNEIETFVGKLSADLTEAGPVNFRDRAARLDLPVDVRERVVRYIDEAESSA